VFFVDNLQFFSYSVTYPAVGMSPLLPECYGTIDNPEARCIKERSSDLRHSCGALLNATPAPTGALQVFLDHKKTSHVDSDGEARIDS